MPRKLTLRTEHLAGLTTAELHRIAGGATTNCPITWRLDDCLTALTCHSGCSEYTQGGSCE